MPTATLPAQEEFLLVVGDRIRHWRQLRGLTQAQLAERVGVSRLTINEYEQGKKNMPLHTAECIRIVLGLRSVRTLTLR